MEDSEFAETKKQEQQVTINKSTYNKLIISIVSVDIFSAFLGGYVIGGETAEPKEVIIRETVQDLQQPRQTGQEQFGPRIIQNISIDDDPMKGNPNAPFTIVEFSDFQCPFCAKFHETTLSIIRAKLHLYRKGKFCVQGFPHSEHTSKRNSSCACF